MTTLQEIARLVREELLTLIRPVQLISVNPSKATGEVSGRFRSNGILFDYAIKGGTVTYRPVGSGGSRTDSADHVVGPDGRLDAARGKPRNCTTGFACGNTCIQKGRNCRAKGGAAAAKLQQAVKMLPAAGQTGGSVAQGAEKKPAAAPAGEAKPKAAAKSAGKGPTTSEARQAVLGYFGAKSVKGLKADKNFQWSMAGDEENPLKSKEDWLKLYRRFIGVPKNERNLPDGPTVINGIDVTKNFRPWTVFGLDPKTATESDIRSAFRKLIIKHHPDQGGDPRVSERLVTMRDSMLALLPRDRKAGSRKDSDLTDVGALLAALRASQHSLRHGWSDARADGYREAHQRLDAAKKNCTKGYGCGSSCI